MGAIEDIKKKATSFHKRVERFFDERIQEATLTRMITVILITGLVIGILTILMAYASDLSRIILALERTPQTVLWNLLQYFFLIISYLLVLVLLPFFSVWVVRKINKKNTKMKRPKLVQIIYPYFIIFALLLSISLLAELFSLLPYGVLTPIARILSEAGGYIIAVIFTYLLLSLFLKLYNPSIAEFLGMIIVTVISTFGLVFLVGVLMILFGLLVKYQIIQMIYSFSLTNSTNGSFTIEYGFPAYKILGLQFPGNTKCNISFPQGWQISNEGENLNYTRAFYYPEGDNRYGLVYKISLRNSSTPELVFFNAIPPEHADSNFINNTYTYLSNSLPSEHPDSLGFIDENVTLTTDSSLDRQIIDVYGFSENKSLVRHIADIEFGNNYLVNFYYQAPYGKDSDFYYILNSIQCSDR